MSNDDVVRLIDDQIAALEAARRPLTDIVSAIDGNLFSLRKARFALRPGEMPAPSNGGSPAEQPTATKRALVPRARKGKQALRGRVAAVFNIVKEAGETVDNEHVLTALKKRGDDCGMRMVNSVLSVLGNRHLLTRQGRGNYRLAGGLNADG